MTLQITILIASLAGLVSGFVLGFVAAVIVGVVIRQRRQWRRLYQIEQEDRAFAETVERAIAEVEKEQTDES
jgi:NhaP-type Na+/H+ or K+/H+ antiporter